MCYANCKYECTYGENVGECRKPKDAICPQDLLECKECGDMFEQSQMETEDTCQDCYDPIAENE